MCRGTPVSVMPLTGARPAVCSSAGLPLLWGQTRTEHGKAGSQSASMSTTLTCI